MLRPHTQTLVLFLDEPTTGVDVVSMTEFWDMLASLKEGGISVLVIMEVILTVMAVILCSLSAVTYREQG